MLFAASACEMNRAPEKSDADIPGPQRREKKPEKPFRRLSFADFEVYTGKLRRGEKLPPGKTWSEKDGVITCSGLPRGYIYTKKSYRNIEIEFEYRFDEPKQRSDIAKLNTGCLLFIEGEHRVWPVCLEVQGKHLEMGQIKSNSRDIKVDPEDINLARTEHRLQPGSWNRIRIYCDEGRLRVELNGRVVAASQTTRLKEGPFGFQAEGWPVQFRNIGVRDVKSAYPDEAKKTE